MTNTFFVRLQLALDGKTAIPSNPKGVFSPAFLARYTYRVKISPNPGIEITTGVKSFSGKFSNLRSTEHQFRTTGASLNALIEANAAFKVIWEIYFDGKLNHTFKGQLFAESRLESYEWNRFNIKFTTANTKPNVGQPNLITQQISSGVGWYLVKKEEAFGDLMTRAFKNPSQIDWDVMREVNSHLGAPSSVMLLKPGQVVIVSKTKSNSNPKLNAMKTAAVKAQAVWTHAYEDSKIDTAEMALIDLLIKGHKLVAIEAGQIEGVNSQTLAQSLNLSDSYKPYADGMIGLTAANFDQVSKAQQALAGVARNIPYTNEKGTVRRATKLAAQTHPKPFTLLNNSSYARKLVYWDTGIQATRARDYIHHEVQLRSANANGGIGAATDNLKNVGRFSKVLRGAGYVGIAIDATTSGVKAYDAYENGDVKGGNVEVGKGVGSIAGGVAGGAFSAAVVGYLILGVVTGGVGLVVVGLAAATVGYASGKGARFLGNFLQIKPIFYSINEQGNILRNRDVVRLHFFVYGDFYDVCHKDVSQPLQTASAIY